MPRAEVVPASGTLLFWPALSLPLSRRLPAVSPRPALPLPVLLPDEKSSLRGVRESVLSLPEASLFRESLFGESLFGESLFGESLFGESLFDESLPEVSFVSRDADGAFLLDLGLTLRSL